ncbi:MAG: NapC/NirT family cytochrome c [Calditrichota bacterium]
MPNKVWNTLWGLFRDFWAACWEVVKLPFWLIGQGFRRLFALGIKKLILLFVAAVIVTIVFVTVMVEATSQPGFCVTCHYMKPYFDSWRTSTHHDVECIKCHVPPGLEGTIKHKFMAVSMVVNYATGLYKRSKPWAEIDDASCLREGCHETRVLSGVENFHNVKFDHRPHLEQPRRDRRLRCTSCHGQIVQGQHITVTEGTCFLCHFKPDSSGQVTELGRCTHCHNPPHGETAIGKPFDHGEILARGVDCRSCHATAVAGDGFVPPERCNMCHAQAAHIERYHDLDFVHERHVTQSKVECLQCHIAIRHGAEAARESHPDEQCATCHGGMDGPILAVWNGTVAGLSAVPSAMAKVGMTCNSCHVEPIHRSDGGYGKPECTPCHTADYDALWPTWGAPLNRSLNELESVARRLPEEKRTRMLKALDTYRKGNPIHNPDLLAELTKAISGTAERAEGHCGTCHAAAAELAPVWNGKAVSHRTHIRAGVACQTCHEVEEPNHGRLKLNAAQCNACHHQAVTAETSCGKCHGFQADVYQGKLAIPGGGEASAMAAAEIACSDCHLADNSVQHPTGEVCAACHEPAYADTLTAWQTNGDALLIQIEQKMKNLSSESQPYRDYAELAAALRRDRSRTVHNPELFIQWMKRIEVAP